MALHSIVPTEQFAMIRQGADEAGKCASAMLATTEEIA